MIQSEVRSPRRKRALFGLVATLLVVLAGCSRDAPMNFLYPEGPAARDADKLWDLVFPIAVVVFFLVEGALVFIMFKYRQRSKDDSPKQVHGNTKLEILWTLIPVLLLVGVAIPTVSGIFKASAEPKGDVLDVDVIAHQWWWEYRYKESGVVTANELHIPVGKPVRLNITSADVIHSFWVPKLGGKQDAVPGRVNKLTLEAERPDEYLGQCAEYCGLSHANMRLKVFSHTSDDFDDWTQSQLADRSEPTDALALKGEELFLKGQFAGQQCSSCHAIKGTEAAGQVAPDLTHVGQRTTFAGSMFAMNDENLKKWLKNPPAQKPGSKMPNLRLKEDEILALVAYLRGLE